MCRFSAIVLSKCCAKPTKCGQPVKTLVNLGAPSEHFSCWGHTELRQRAHTQTGKYIKKYYYHPQDFGGQVYTSSGPSGIALCACPYGGCPCRSPNAPVRILSWNAANSASSCSVIATFFQGFGSRVEQPCKCVASTESRRGGRSA